MKTLVAFYSHMGNTRKVGEEIARLMKADVEDIIDLSESPGFGNSPAALKMKEAFHKKYKKGESPFAPSDFLLMSPYFVKFITGFFGLNKIARPVHDPADYDLVIIGTPVWADSALPAVKTYLKESSLKLKRVAFYCTMGSDGTKAFSEMRAIVKKEPIATLGINAKEVENGTHSSKIKAFVKQLKKAR